MSNEHFNSDMNHLMQTYDVDGFNYRHADDLQHKAQPVEQSITTDTALAIATVTQAASATELKLVRDTQQVETIKQIFERLSATRTR